MTGRLDWDRDGQTWPNRAASAFVSAAGLRWHVQTMGTGPVLLLLHGTGASTHSVRKLMCLLASRFTVIAPDLPGHAFTSQPDVQGLTLPGMAAEIGALMRVLGVSPALAVGHSAGAAILIRAALDGEIDPAAVVSINGALLPFGSPIGQFFSPIAKVMAVAPFVHQFMAWRAGSLTAVEELLRGTGSRPTSEDVALYAVLFRNAAHVQATLGMMAHWDLHALSRDLHRLKPLLVLLVGLEDRAIPPRDAEKVAARVRCARIVRLAGAGHLAHEEQPDEVAATIVATAKELSVLPTGALNS